MDAWIVVGIVTAREHAGARIVVIDAAMRTLEIASGFARGSIGSGFVDEAAGFDELRDALGIDIGHEAEARDVGDVVGVFTTRLERAGIDRLLERALEIADQPARRDPTAR